MDTDTPAGAGAGADLDRDGPGLVSSQSPFFPGSHHFTIAGGTFNSFNSALTVPSDFRMIPLGDIDLQREIQVEFRVDDDSGVVSQQDRRCVRRVYSANVEGSKVAKTVAIYEGDSAEGEWRRDIAFYTAFRHPHLMQVFGAASSPGIHATVFHGDLIPFEHFVNHHRNSPILTVYMFGYISAQFWMTERSFRFGVTMFSVGEDLGRMIKSLLQHNVHPTLWVRRSTGMLSIELLLSESSPRGPQVPKFVFELSSSPDMAEMILGSADPDTMASRGLSLPQYHGICNTGFPSYRHASVSPSATVTLAGVTSRAKEFENPRPLTWVRDADICSRSGWCSHYEGVLTPSGFTRFNSVDVSREMCIAHFTVATDELKAVAWLSQANHIFHRVGITASLEDYLLVHYTVFTVNLSYATANMPQGYLFLCPLEDFQVGPSSFRWPDCPGYWSLDPLGIEHLSTDEATCLGFPPVSLTTRIWGRSWDASVYAGIRQFHAAKGFDPDGQEVARHLGYPLYELCSEVDVLFAHVECESFDSVEPPVSRGFKILMNVQLALILFLLLCQAYETVV